MIAEQFPAWAHLAVAAVEPGGRDNRTFRLGDALCVRVPIDRAHAARVRAEHDWLPRLAPRLPLSIPVPLALGEPARGLPWSWSIRGWLEGESRAAFRRALGLDEATWARARGWALWKALLELRGGPEARTAGTRDPRRVIEELWAERRA